MKFLIPFLIVLLGCQLSYASEEIGNVALSRISTPDEVQTSIGTLEYIDGAPLPATAEKVYDYLDTMRAVDVFLKGIPAASIQGMMEGPRVIGQKKSVRRQRIWGQTGRFLRETFLPVVSPV